MLVSYETLQELTEKLKEHFNIVPGGGATTGVTINKLNILPDGTYLEIVAFNKGIEPEKREAHRWSNATAGSVIDWASTLNSPDEFEPIQRRANGSETGIFYQDPVPGGRKRPDGVELKWSIILPVDEYQNRFQPGIAPFWCLDKTPRSLRVPYLAEDGNKPAACTQHPCGAQSVCKLEVLVPRFAAKDMEGLRFDSHLISQTSHNNHFPLGSQNRTSATKFRYCNHGQSLWKVHRGQICSDH